MKSPFREFPAYAFAIAVLALAVLACPAAGQTAPAAPSLAVPPITAEEHWAKDEIKCGDGWVPIDKVFQDYLASKAELEPLAEKLKAARDDAAAIQLQMNNMKNENLAAERPIRNDLGKTNANRREIARAAESPEPPKPQLQQVPPRPRDYSANIRNSSSGNYQNSSNNALDNWRREVDAINRANDAASKKYQADMAKWRKARDDAKTQLPKIDEEIKALNQKLEQSAAALTTKQAPLMEKYKAANEEALGIGRKISAVETRIQALVDALRAAPEALRFKHGICEWEGAFSTLPELEKLLDTTQAEIDRVVAQLRTEAKQAGRPLPDNWRHPQQDRMDALKSLITEAKAAAAK